MLRILLITMGSSISGIIADIFLLYCGQLILKRTCETKTIIYSRRYVDDILIIFDSTVTSEEYIMNLMKNIHFNLYFTFTWVENYCLNFLDHALFKKKKRQTRSLHKQKTNKHRYHHTQRDKYLNSGIYNIKCLSCNS